jgi:acyl-CoA reductase-like NAD-dependent aldehyde dehydrogenase
MTGDARLPVLKTVKLFVGGAFPRSESGRVYEAEGVNAALASRKDVRDAVKAARGAWPGWAKATAYNRGQVLYRLAELMETRAPELAAACTGADEVARAIDRVVWYAGWTDKLAQVIGGANPVAGPYFDFTVPEPTGVVGIVAPAEPPLAGLVSRLAPALAGGNTVVVLAAQAHPLAAIALAECVATADVPAGVVNILTGDPAETAPWLAGHMDVNAVDITGAGPELAAALGRAAADNVKRVVHGPADGQRLADVEQLLELKTVWHPIGL